MDDLQNEHQIHTFCKTLFQKELNTAKEFNIKEKVFEAYNTYKSCEELFDGLNDISIAKNEKEQIKNSKKFKKFIKEFLIIIS